MTTLFYILVFHPFYIQTMAAFFFCLFFVFNPTVLANWERQLTGDSSPIQADVSRPRSCSSLLAISFCCPLLRHAVSCFSSSPPGQQQTTTKFLSFCRHAVTNEADTTLYISGVGGINHTQKKDLTKGIIWELRPTIKLSSTPPRLSIWYVPDGHRRRSWRVQVHRIVPKRRRLALRELDRAPGEMCLSVSYAWIGTGPQEIQSPCHKPSEENALPKKTKNKSQMDGRDRGGRLCIPHVGKRCRMGDVKKKKKIWISAGGFAVILPVERNFGQQMPADVESCFFFFFLENE